MNENPRRRRRERPVLSTPIRTVAVVGASLAGLSAVEALRNLGYDGHVPSYHLLTSARADRQCS